MNEHEKPNFRRAIENVLDVMGKSHEFTDEELIRWKMNQGMLSAQQIQNPKFRANWLKDAKCQIGLVILAIELR